MQRITILLILASVTAFAGEQVGTLTQLEGDVKLFTNPSKKLPTEANGTPRALFQGEYYLVQNAKVGDRVQQGNILRTALNGKTRVVFDNGDQFHVGPGTSYRVFWNEDSAAAQTKINLVYGKLRGIVAKGGPRSRLQVKTRAVTMGVRGTEFFIAENGGDGETEISIIRGSVEVKPIAATQESKPIEVKTGYSATIAAVAPAEEKKGPAPTVPEPTRFVPVVELRRTTQEDLVGIQKSSELKVPAADAKPIPTELATKMEMLEKKAVETTLKDIKTHDPQLFAKLQTESITSTEQLNVKTVETLIKEAPKAPPKRKPFKSELEDLEQGAYEKYFKIVE